MTRVTWVPKVTSVTWVTRMTYVTWVTSGVTGVTSYRVTSVTRVKG